MNLKTAARRLGVHYQTAYRWVRSGELVAVKIGAGYEISEAALERFEARRVAMERIPAPPDRPGAGVGVVGDDVPAATLADLRDMVRCTTIDASAVCQRAAQVLATAIGDAVTISLRDEDGSLRLAAFDHPDAARAVAMGAMLRFGTSPDPMYVRQAADTGETVLVPQVPQRDVRTRIRPEFHESLMAAGFYSAISAPIVGDDSVRGAVLVSRDTPGRPHTIEDRDFVLLVAGHIGAAIAQAERGRGAWAARAKMVDALGDWLVDRDFDRAGEWLARHVADSEAIAVVDLDIVVDGATSAFAELFGATAADLKSQSLTDVARPTAVVRQTFDRLRRGEFDYCTTVVEPVNPSRPAVVLHGATIRLADATPRYVLYVAHEAPMVVAPQPQPQSQRQAQPQRQVQEVQRSQPHAVPRPPGSLQRV